MSYVLFMDESGDHNLLSIDNNFPVFCLAGCIFERRYYQQVVRKKIDQFKLDTWGRTDVILHSREIRKHQGDFAFLDTEEKRLEFYKAIDRMMTELEFIILAVVILKYAHKNQYGGYARHPYHLSLEFIMERYSMIMNRHSKKEDGYMLAESRGDQEDKLLKEEYNQLHIHGTKYCRMDNITSFWMEKKEANIVGLQIADLVAYPIAAKVLRPTFEQKAFDVLASKINAALPKKGGGILGYGLKIFPQPTFEHLQIFGS